MNDYFLRILIRERQRQLRREFGPMRAKEGQSNLATIKQISQWFLAGITGIKTMVARQRSENASIRIGSR